MRRVVSLLHNVLWERMGDWFRERGLKGGNSVDNIFELLFVRSFVPTPWWKRAGLRSFFGAVENSLRGRETDHYTQCTVK